jgi:hypothetical protein
VVDVLQAIHLLLALPLFVAVVGVDLRWLLHSLDQQYTAFQSANNRRGTDRSLRPEWVTDPQNYLEKIFQIPFTLKTMQERGYEKLISVLMPEAKIAAGNEPKPADTYAGIGKKDGENHELERVQVFQEGTNEGVNGKNEKPDGVTDQEGEGESSADAADSDEDRDLDPEALMIKDWERAFAARMFPFIPTPRAAKRFTNTYRILKAPLTAKELVDFEGTSDKPGEFQAAMLLLDHMAVTEPQGEILEKIKLGNDPFVFWAPFVARFTFEAAKAIQSPLVAKSQQKRPLPSSFVGAASVFCLTLGRRNSKVNYFPPSEEKQ